MFTDDDYKDLHALTFVEGYLGYKPEVKEIPNGDGKVDAEKRYAHIATRYFTSHEQRIALMPYLQKAHRLATDIARAIRMPPQFYPQMEVSSLRILEYPPGAVSNEHCDFDLFTLMLHRNQPDRFVSKGANNDTLRYIRHFNLQAHMGELGTEIGLGEATPHSVLPSETVQRSIVYFAIPAWDATLPSGIKVKDWLNARMARSRTSFKAYE